MSTPRHRGERSTRVTWHLGLGLLGEYGPHVQEHLVGRYLLLCGTGWERTS